MRLTKFYDENNQIYYLIPMENKLNKLEQLLNSLIEKGWLPR